MSFSPWCRRGVDLMDIILREDVENMFNVSRWAECSLLKFYKFTFSRKSKTCGYYTNKAHGSNEGNQHECILLLLLVFVLFSLNSRGRNRTAREDRLDRLWLVGFVGFVLSAWLVSLHRWCLVVDKNLAWQIYIMQVGYYPLLSKMTPVQWNSKPTRN